MDTYDAAEVRDLLAAIRDALDPPAAVTYDGLGMRDRVIVSRANYMVGAISQALETGRLPSAPPIRRLAERPLGYEAMGGAS